MGFCGELEELWHVDLVHFLLLPHLFNLTFISLHFICVWRMDGGSAQLVQDLGPRRSSSGVWEEMKDKEQRAKQSFSELLGYKSKYFSFSVLEIKWKEEFP